MNKKSRWIVAVGLVLALVLAVAPTQVLADPDNTVDPDGPYNVGVGDTFTVYVNVDNIAAPGICIATFDMGYDNTVIEMTDLTTPFSNIRAGDFWGAASMTVSASLFSDRVRVLLEFNECSGFPPPGTGISGGGCLAEIDFEVVGVCDDTSELDLYSYGPDGTGVNTLRSPQGVKLTATWGDSLVTVEPCGPQPPCAPPPTVVSGIAVVGAPGSNEPGAWVPAGYEPCDEFQPCEWVYIWGETDPCHFCNFYTIWIQPYGPYGDMPDPSVVDGQVLDPALCPPGFPPEGIPIEVHIGEDGKFGPVAIWHVDGEYCELWEIVADKFDEGTVGVYDADWDGLDAACLGEWGFHIYPEGLTIILLSLGLVAVGGYILVVRRRRGAETDS